MAILCIYLEHVGNYVGDAEAKYLANDCHIPKN